MSFKLQVLKTASVSTQQIAGIPCLAYRCFNMMSIYFLRLYVNTGALNASVSSAGTTTPGYSLTVANNSFNATCSFTINYLNETAASGGLGSTTLANITPGLHLAKVPATTYNCVNLSTSAASSHPLPACRIYCSQITLQPSFAKEYILNHRAKRSTDKQKRFF